MGAGSSLLPVICSTDLLFVQCFLIAFILGRHIILFLINKLSRDLCFSFLGAVSVFSIAI